MINEWSTANAVAQDQAKALRASLGLVQLVAPLVSLDISKRRSKQMSQLTKSKTKSVANRCLADISQGHMIWLYDRKGLLWKNNPNHKTTPIKTTAWHLASTRASQSTQCLLITWLGQLPLFVMPKSKSAVVQNWHGGPGMKKKPNRKLRKSYQRVLKALTKTV